MPINLIATHTACLPRAAGGARARFFNRVLGTSPRIVSLLRVILLSIFVSLFFSPPFPPLASLRQPDRNQSCRTFIRSDRCEMCFDVAAPVLPRVLLHSRARIFLSYGSRRCKRVDASTAVWYGRRLMSPRQLRARVCHFDSIRHGDG